MATLKRAKDITGEDLKRRGFKPDTKRERASSVPTSAWYVQGNIRVCQDGEDGFEVFAFDEGTDGQWKGTTNGGLDWQTRFSGATPAEFVMSFLFKVTGG
jgi:hypothetical protein